MSAHYSFRDFISIQGRWSRQQFIMPNIALNIFSKLYLSCCIFLIKQLPPSESLFYQLFIFFLYTALLLLILIPAFCITAKRLHDLGHSAGWAFIFILLPQILFAIPGNSDSTPFLVAILLSSYLYFFKGTPGLNKYGPDPLAADTEAAPDDKGDVT